MPDVPYISKQDIELRAERLLLEFARAQGRAPVAPIPVEEILETHLGFTLDFDDLATLMVTDGSPVPADLLGATWIEKKEVFADESLDPTVRPQVLGRYRFTIGHEVGHIVLHGPGAYDPDQFNLFGEAANAPRPFCKSQDKGFKEVQANQFASCLLMPKSLVLDAWKLRFGDIRPRTGVDAKVRARLPGRTNLARAVALDRVLDLFARTFAQQFQVSAEAMRIRLENLGLLIRDPGALGHHGLQAP